MEILLSQYMLYVIIAIFLAVAAVFDLHDGTIPLPLFPTLFALFVPLAVMSENFNPVSSFIGLLIAFFCFFILARFFDGGGGDILMMSVLGWCLGARNLVCLIFAAGGFYLVFSLFVALIYLLRKRPVREALKAQYPYAPFVLAGYAVCFVSGWLV